MFRGSFLRSANTWVWAVHVIVWIKTLTIQTAITETEKNTIVMH